MDHMFKHCVFCYSDLGTNETLGHFPVARRVAFDPSRGRLWAVCPGCGRWNLAPIEERWEALEELDRLVTDSGRLLSQTENIALARAGELDVVRVGRARLNEEAWWRYGRELKARRSFTSKLGYVENLAALALMGSGFGLAVFIGNASPLKKGVRYLKYGNTAWRGETSCARCGSTLTVLTFKRAKDLAIVQDGADGVALELRCQVCGHIGTSGGGYRMTGVQSEHVLRRVLAHSHYSGASEKRVKAATQLIDQVGSSGALARTIARNRATISTLSSQALRTESIALEIAVNDDNERRLLELELEDLEARWKEEEEIAAIVDRELTPMHVVTRYLGMK
jgi:hypothetical protein